MNKTATLFASPFLLIVILFCLGAKSEGCKSNGGMEQYVSGCGDKVTLRDHRSLDGCSFLLQDGEGNEYLVDNFDFGLTAPYEGKAFYASYTVVQGMASICMKEDGIATLSCLATDFSNYNLVLECTPMVDPFRVDWSAQLMQIFYPKKVVEITAQKTLFYKYTFDGGEVLFDCAGNFLCFNARGQGNKCDLPFQKQEEKVIYVLDNLQEK